MMGMLLKKGGWTQEEDQKLIDFIRNNDGYASNWRTIPKLAGIVRCGKSCRLRWKNYLRPNINRSPFSEEERNIVVQLHSLLGNRWAAIASRLPGRTDNDVRNYWNYHLRKQKDTTSLDNTQLGSPKTRHTVQWESVRLEAETRLSLVSTMNPFGYPVTNSDPYLHLWHSEIGDSFRKLGDDPVSSSHDACSSSECGLGSDITGRFIQPKEEQHRTKSYSDDSEQTSSDIAFNMRWILQPVINSGCRLYNRHRIVFGVEN